MIERAVLFCDKHRDRRGRHPRRNPRSHADAAAVDLRCRLPAGLGAGQDGLKEQVKAAMSRLERELIVRALEQTSGNVTHAARLLKISRKGLQLKMKELGLRERDDAKDP